MEAAILKATLGLVTALILFFMKNHHDKIKSLESENRDLKDMVIDLAKERVDALNNAKNELYTYISSTKKDLIKDIKSGNVELEALIDSKSSSQLKALERRFSDFAEEVSKISEIQRQLQANTTDIEWLKKAGSQ